MIFSFLSTLHHPHPHPHPPLSPRIFLFINGWCVQPRQQSFLKNFLLENPIRSLLLLLFSGGKTNKQRKNFNFQIFYAFFSFVVSKKRFLRSIDRSHALLLPRFYFLTAFFFISAFQNFPSPPILIIIIDFLLHFVLSSVHHTFNRKK